MAIDLPAHGGTPPRADLSVRAMTEAVAELCDGLGLEQVDLVANDTGGAIAQIFAARYPERIRSLTLTNCDTEGNFPPAEFVPIVEMARRGELTDGLVTQANAPATWRTGPLAARYEDPARIPDEVWREYYASIGATVDCARDFERVLAGLDPAELSAVSGALRTLTAPTLIVWGTGDPMFGIEWAYRLREMIPGARDLIEVAGAKLFFPEERPDDLVPHLRSHWGALAGA